MQGGRSKDLLCEPRFERDSCGVGFVADIAGASSHGILTDALGALCNMAHRGAVDADGKTGDGAGVLTQIPRKLFEREAAKLGRAPGSAADIAVGMLFLPRETAAAAHCRKIVEKCLESHGLNCLGWRSVPVDSSALGAKAASTAPLIEQILIECRSCPADEYERWLYLARKQIESRTAVIPEFYVASLSSQTLVYKGLFVATQIELFYGDLRDPDYETALAVVHQRYSTNTFPNWSLAQPFRMLAHNGEINTITGNRNWMRAREAGLRSEVWGASVDELKPLVCADGSDSASLDNMLELLVRSDRDVLQSMMMLAPEAHENSLAMDAALRGFYEYSACLVEPWDGPAAVAFSDGRFVGAALDRNGLRPARYAITRDGRAVMASEAGAIDLDPEMIVENGRLGPGEMFAVDTEQRILLTNDRVKLDIARRRPYADWVRRSTVLRLRDSSCEYSAGADPSLTRKMLSFGYTREDLDRVLDPMLQEAKEPVGSMGDDTPLAAFSERSRLLYRYFKQRFAQVTNPAIDSTRERLVMSLETFIGPRGQLLDEHESHARLIKLESPILTAADLQWLLQDRPCGFSSRVLAALFDPAQGAAGFERALETLCDEAAAAAAAGCAILVLSDSGVSETRAPIPMLLATGAVHQHLVGLGKRLSVSLVIDTGEAREDHHFACLIGNGANAVHPFLAFHVIAQKAAGAEAAQRGVNNYISAVEKGLLKIMAKMGISTIASYCGAQIFEILGLDGEIVDKYFTGTPARLDGVGLGQIAEDAARFHNAAFSGAPALEDAGFYRYRKGGEFHSFNPDVFRALHKVARGGSVEDYKLYKNHTENRPPTTVRDLLDFSGPNPIPIDAVEPAADIVRRFSTSGMSHGALSREAHETLAIAMNRMGARSNSGEGGEDPRRVSAPYAERMPYGSPGDSANSRIKQVASARFGVTPQYLVSADELEIKMAQGSKPGEGGQLPGHKVSAEIGAIRHAATGVTLISPPPHHDIYSIEDLAQLIYDLRQINPGARIAVKLVSEAGIGAVAAGVAKAHADVIHISGHDGGTGASPLGSLKNVGVPWELGLAETQQALVVNDLRGRVRLRVDGGLKSGRDIVMAAMFGAEEYGFASTALVALGCVMARQCHLNTCPVGIATQAKGLRERYAGKPEMVINFFLALAEEVREILASLGFRSLEEIVGRTDLLRKRDLKLARAVSPGLRRLLAEPDPTRLRPRRFEGLARPAPATVLDDHILSEVREGIATAKPVAVTHKIRNTDRTVGAKIAGEITRLRGSAGLPDETIQLTFRGSAGQSFGAFATPGMTLCLIGEANDYVGKGMAGGRIVIRPAAAATFDWSQSVIAGNTLMYGATGGELFAAGRVGERFCVRNSGGRAVVEGVGDHGCEYMTAGTVVVLGRVGRNFAAGMTGGIAYVLDLEGDLERNYNDELVRLEAVSRLKDLRTLRQFVNRHYILTGSPRARSVLRCWNSYWPRFRKVVVRDAGIESSEADALAEIEAALPPRVKTAEVAAVEG